MSVFVILWIASMVGVVYIASTYNFKRPVYLLVLNTMVPFAGLAFALYAAFVVRPREEAKALGLPPPPSAIYPYMQKLHDTLAPVVEPLRRYLPFAGDKDKKNLID
jgi:hypothetical protein